MKSAFVLFTSYCAILMLSGCSLFSASFAYEGDQSDWQGYNSELSQQLDALVFRPETNSSTGLVFYPGGKVEPEAYGHLASQIVLLNNIWVVITPMPLDLAILNGDAGQAIQQQLPEIENWIIGGHSLGGVVAAGQAFEPDNQWQGLVLLASYPQSKHDFSATSLPLLTLIGSKDTVVDQELWQQRLSLMPKTAQVVKLQGANHAGFGDYGAQPDDTEADISNATQQTQTAALIEQWLAQWPASQ